MFSLKGGVLLAASPEAIDRHFESPLEAAARVVRLRGFSVRVEQRWADGQGTGGALWRGAVVLAHWLARLPRVFWRRRRVLELGAGTGLCGIVAAKLGAASVLCTDGSAGAVGVARRNLSGASLDGVSVDVAELQWASDDVCGAFDVIIAADCVYAGASGRELLACIRRHARRGVFVFIAFDEHGRGEGALRDFVREAEHCLGQVVKRVGRCGDADGVTLLVVLWSV